MRKWGCGECMRCMGKKTNKNLCFLNRWCRLPLPLRAARSIPNSNSVVQETNKNFQCFTDTVLETVLSLSDPSFVILYRSMQVRCRKAQRVLRQKHSCHNVLLFTNSHKQNRASHANGKRSSFQHEPVLNQVTLLPPALLL